MRLFSLLLALLALLSLQPGTAAAEDGLGIVFTGNSWGFLKPCPS